ncbi:hypothetical protein DEO72_LG5g1714 [Vigna unguiculata]|uniref:Uncharacterized protein n=1 Tax=Vigna unguiculata TaxID=3917 RepID=A0A4D6LZ65_VIGUN|nr:hypothetical protein DEO72_LG5g1714 [Vigna unguiculata]
MVNHEATGSRAIELRILEYGPQRWLYQPTSTRGCNCHNGAMGGKILQETQTSTAQVLIQRLAVVFDRQAIVAKLVRYRNKGHLAVKIALPGDTYVFSLCGLNTISSGGSRTALGDITGLADLFVLDVHGLQGFGDTLKGLNTWHSLNCDSECHLLSYGSG